jgi:hypothetical protein
MVLVLAGLAMTVAATGGSTAQEPGEPRIRLHVSEFTGVLGPGTVAPPEDDTLDPDADPEPPTTLELRVLVENRGSRPLDAARLVVEVYPPAVSRAELREAFEGDLPTEPVLVDDPAIREGVLPAGDIAGLARSYDRDLIPWAEDGGVHPVRIAVIRGTEILDELMTAVVWLADPPTEPIRTVMVWPLDEAPWRSVGGAYPVDVDRSTHDGGRLDNLIRALERYPSAPVVLAPSAHLLEDLRDRADGFSTVERIDLDVDEHRVVVPEASEARRANDLLQRIREVADTLPYAPVGGSYADADLSALHATGDRAARVLAGDAASSGRFRLQIELGRAPDGAAHLLHDGVAPPVLDLLPGDQLLLPHAATTAAAGGAAVALPDPIRGLRSPAGRSLTALVADPHLSDLVTRSSHPAGPKVAMQRILAESAMFHLERPTASGRSLLLLPEADWDPGLEAATLLLDHLTDAPWLELSDISSTIADGRRGVAPLELVEPAPGEFPAAFSSELTAALAELEAAREMLPEDVSAIDGRTPSELEDTLARAASSWFRSDTQRVAQQLVTDVRGSLRGFFGEVSLSESTVTLTSDRGQVPVTLARTSGGPVLVQIEVASQGRLVWPEGRRSAVILLTEDSSATVAFPTEALSTGRFPVTVTVQDPSGRYPLHRTTVIVRSTAISGPALAGIGALVVVLLLIGALRRRRPTAELTVVGSEDGRPEPAEPRY